jgi:shikimate kinase
MYCSWSESRLSGRSNLATFSHNVVLIGMPGVGKSTVGVLVAKQLGFGYLDTDILIQTREGKTLQQLITRLGREGFCRLEARHILSVELSEHVIATGGSVVYDAEAMRHLKSGGCIVHLHLKVDALKQRLDDVVGRGVVIAPGKSVRDLYAERRPLYRTHSDITVDTDGLTPAEVTAEICDRLERFAAAGQ